jgi:tetratricopeptide (TPR) repeat protein
MRFTIVYLILVSFTFLSLTPAGVSLAELRADDGFELEELDLGLEEDEEESEEESSSEKSKKSDEELDEEESSESSEDSEESEEEEDSEEESPKSKRSSKADDSESYTSSGKKIMAVYVFEDSHTVKAAGHVAAETASRLAASKDFDYVGTEAAIESSSSASWLKNAKKNFEEGKALYNDLGVEEAIEKFKSALKYLEDNIDKVADMTLMSDVIFYLGASHELLDEDDKAESYFSTYLSINPDGQPEGSTFSEEVMSAFEGVKSDRKSAGKGSLKVQCNQNGALVFIDGKIAGMTPLTLRGISEGKHYYRIHKNGFRPAGGSISVRGGKTTTINETINKSASASAVSALEEEMKSGFGSLAMIRKATDLAEDNGLNNVFVVKASLGADERLKYQGIMIDCDKKEFKKTEAVMDLPEKDAAADSASLKQFNKALVDDPYEYKAISDLLMEEADLLGLSDKPAEEKKDDKEKKPIYKEWWLWTVVGVVVAGGVAAGVVCGLGKCTGGNGSNGATLDINIQ